LMYVNRTVESLMVDERRVSERAPAEGSFFVV
jgi:hypothetical protein